MDTSYYKKYEPIFGKWHIVRELVEEFRIMSQLKG